MRRLVTGKQMKEIDVHAIEEIGIPSLVLMERAALAVAGEVERAADRAKSRILAVCGTGNNGADGVAAARILHLRGFDVTVLTAGGREKRTREMERQLSIAENLEISVMELNDFIPGRYNIVVDALFGVGLSRPLEGEFIEAVELIGKLKPELTVAVDIPSGIHSDTGMVMGAAVRADITVTFGFEKLGTVLYPGKGLSGRVMVEDIGFPDFPDASSRSFFAFEACDLALIPGRRPDAHKGVYGKVLVVAGSSGMCGAAYLSALAAYRTGAGLVKVLTAQENRTILQGLLPEAILTTYSPETEEEEPEEFRELVEKECAWASVIVLGPGLGKGRHVKKLVEYVLLSAYVPIILDADGLNAVAEYPYLSEFFTENVIVTPHLGEMAGLTGREIPDLKENLVKAAIDYSEQYGVTCILKDAVSVVARKDGSVFLNVSGNGGMAKAGSGDVLTGIVAGLIALGFCEDEAAAFGAYLHGLAGEAAGGKKGEHAILAREIADSVMQALAFTAKADEIS